MMAPDMRGAAPQSLVLKAGTVGGLVGVYVVAVGVFAAFAARPVVAQSVSLGQIMLLSIALAVGWSAADPRQGRSRRLATAAAAGVLAGLVYAGVLLVAREAKLQAMFVALSPAALNTGLFGKAGISALVAAAAIAGLSALAGGLVRQMPAPARRTLLAVGVAILIGALLRDLWISFFSNLLGGRWWVSTIYAGNGLSWTGTAVAVAVGLAWQAFRTLGRREAGKQRTSLAGLVLLLAAAILIPYFTNAFVAQVMLLVGLYALMGTGLNIELGLAGLLDLGFVAFFAIGAYVTALLTADSPLAIAQLSFWEALPIATLCAAAGGFVFGLPVLRVRGDYLALATLGLGEIVRLLVVSDMSAPFIGGAQGIVGIPRPELAGAPMVSQLSLYYLTLALTCLVALAGWRLQHSPIGRAWAAAREDEDVAATLGIDLVQSKLRAYVLGAAFAGVAGALFATTLGSIFPQSFKLDVSINVLALLVVGGLGSLPGVFVGSLILIGLPEFLREFGEYRYLFYGFLLILVMRVRPQGLWPDPLQARSS